MPFPAFPVVARSEKDASARIPVNEVAPGRHESLPALFLFALGSTLVLVVAAFVFLFWIG